MCYEEKQSENRKGSAKFQLGVMVWIALLIELSWNALLKRWQFIKYLNISEREKKQQVQGPEAEGCLAYLRNIKVGTE